MNRKVNYISLIVAACLIIGIGLYIVISANLRDRESRSKPRNPVSEKMFQTVEKAKKGDRGELRQMIESIQRGEGTYASKELLPDYLTFLKDKDGQVQLLGSTGLYLLKSPESKDALQNYLRGKDLVKVEQVGSAAMGISPQDYVWQLQAASSAITTLGKVGDKSSVPILQSLRGAKNLQFEWGGGPVEDALADLGAVDTLVNLPPGADEVQIHRAGHTIQGIRDLKKAPDLMSVVRNKATALSIRRSAIYALGEIGSPQVAEFLLEVLNDSNYPKDLRFSAAAMAGKTKEPMVEKALFAYAEDRGSDIRTYATVGLALCMPEKYLNKWFERIMDTNEDERFRERLIATEMYIPRTLLRNYRQHLYQGLDSSDKDGQPLDRIRVQMWRLINEVFLEEPTVVLTSKSPNTTSNLRGAVRLKLLRQNPRLGYADLEKKVDSEIDTIVKVSNQ